jgi:hypothetical protein
MPEVQHRREKAVEEQQKRTQTSGDHSFDKSKRCSVTATGRKVY